jgi:hypothetical protein
MPSILPPPPSASLSKEEHLAAIQAIEREETQIRDMIHEKQCERELLQTILDTLPKKESSTNGTTTKR